MTARGRSVGQDDPRAEELPDTREEDHVLGVGGVDVRLLEVVAVLDRVRLPDALYVYF